MSLTPTTKSNPCAICENSTGKCRQGKNDSGYWQCMTYADARKGEVINGYKSLGTTRDSLWGQFRLEDISTGEYGQRFLQVSSRSQTQGRTSSISVSPVQGRGGNQSGRMAAKGQNVPSRNEKSGREANHLLNGERDRAIRRLHNYFGLSSHHKEDLIKRGLTDSQIDRQLYFTITPNQEVPFGIPANLPGVKEGKIKGAGQGYACVTFDSQGKATGWQIRLDEATDNKYRWAKSEVSSHLANGELPITSVYPSEIKHPGIWMCEGISKPAIAAHRLGIVAIGAASANFASSPQQSEEHLKAAAERVRAKEIIFAPDGGAVSNPHVLKAYKRSWELLTNLGYEIRVAWWEQFTKNDPDVDELDDISVIRYINLDEFLELSKQTERQVKKAEKERQKRLEREAEEAIYESFTSVVEKPWKVVNQPLIDLASLNLEPGAIYIVLSPKGTGKTKALVPILLDFEGVLAWFNRVALGREECHKIGLTWKDDLSADKGKKRGFCSDSAHQFSPSILGADGLLLVDECDQVFEHNFGATCNKDGKRPLILAILEAHLNSAIYGGGMALLMSADISQKEIDYIKAIAPVGCPVRLIVNEYKPPKGTVLFDSSDKPDGMIEQLLMDLEEGKPCFVIDDIKNGVRGCKSIAEYIRTIHPEWSNEIVEINSDTSGDTTIIEFLKNINEASTKTRLICCSPSVISGISIENGRFIEGVYGFANGILTANEMSQALTRVRGANTVNLWVAKEGLGYAANHATDPREIKAWYKRNYQANSKHILSFKAEYDPMTQEWDSPHFDLFCKNAAYRNLCMKDLRRRLQDKLEGEGWTIIQSTSSGSDMVEQGLTESWSKIELDYAEAVAIAPLLSDEELEQIQRSGKNPSPEQKKSLEKTYMLKSFGKELIEATTLEHQETGKVLSGYAAMYLKNERGVYKQQLDNFLLLTSDSSEAIARDLAVEAKQLQHNEGRFPADVRWRTRQKKAREFLGLDKFLDPDKWWEPKDYAEMAAKAKEIVPMIKDALNLSVEKINGGQIFGELMQQLGLELEKKWAERAAGQRRFKRRRISTESWNLAQMYVAYRESLKTEAVEAVKTVELDHPPLDLYTNPILEGGVIQSESQTVELDHPPLDLYTNPILEGGVIQSESQDEHPVERLYESFQFCQSANDFNFVVKSIKATSEQIEDAIALQDTQPRRRLLRSWYEASVRLPLSAYSEGDEVWGYFPHSEAKWLKATVRWVRDGLVRIESGFLGMLIEQADLIAPYRCGVWSDA